MNQTNSDSQLTANEQAEHIQTAPQPKKSHKTLIIVLCIIGLLAIGATVAVVMLNCMLQRVCAPQRSVPQTAPFVPKRA